MSAKRAYAKRPALPPFGVSVRDAVRRGERPNVFICAGTNAWQRHSGQPARIVLPPGEDPAAFDWRFMRGLEPTIVGDDCPRKTLRKLAWLLLRAGCPLVCLLYKDAIDDNVVQVAFFRLE